MLTTKHDDPNGKLGWGERLAYGSGGFAFNMINGIIGSFLTIYFTSAAGLNAGIIATILAVSKIFDGISDLIMGRIVDRTDTKMGKARVWLLRMCIPFAVSTMLLFFVPQGFPDMVKYVYVFLIYNICNAVCLTGMLVPFYSMVGLVTADSYERGLLGNIQQIFQTLGNVFVNSTFVILLIRYPAHKVLRKPEHDLHTEIFHPHTCCLLRTDGSRITVLHLQYQGACKA